MLYILLYRKLRKNFLSRRWESNPQDSLMPDSDGREKITMCTAWFVHATYVLLIHNIYAAFSS